MIAKLQSLLRRAFMRVEALFNRAFGDSGSHVGRFLNPSGIAVSEMNEIFICDELNGRVQVFSEQGVYLRKLRWPDVVPFSVACVGNQIFVACRKRKSIYVFSVRGQFLRILPLLCEPSFIAATGDAGLVWPVRFFGPVRLPRPTHRITTGCASARRC